MLEVFVSAKRWESRGAQAQVRHPKVHACIKMRYKAHKFSP